MRTNVNSYRLAVRIPTTTMTELIKWSTNGRELYRLFDAKLIRAIYIPSVCHNSDDVYCVCVCVLRITRSITIYLAYNAYTVTNCLRSNRPKVTFSTVATKWPDIFLSLSWVQWAAIYIHFDETTLLAHYEGRCYFRF